MNITKATPRPIIQGILDDSRRAQNVEPEQIPQHLPHVYLLAERGPTTPELVIGDSAIRTYGAETFNLRGKFATHQTVLANTFSANANAMMIQRVIPTNAKKALLRIALEVIRSKIPKYLRNADGTFQTDADGVLQQDGSNVVEGYRLVWRRGVGQWTGAAANFGAGTIVSGFRAGSVTVGSKVLSSYGVDAESDIYPILDLEVSHHGGYGNRIGFRLSAPNDNTLPAGDVAAMNTVKSFMYRIGLLERPMNVSTPNLIATNGGDLFQDLCFTQDTVHPQTGTFISMDEMLIQNYQDLETPGLPKKWGPFGRMFIYQDNLESILTKLTQGEAAAGALAATVGEASFDTDAITAGYGRTTATGFTNTANKRLLNIFTGVDQYNVPYETFTTADSVSFGGIAFNDNTTHYAVNGSDGLTNDDTPSLDERLKDLATFDSLVANQVANYGDLAGLNMLDAARYPVSTIWDSGFSIETKKKLYTAMGRRKDMYVVISSQAVAEYADPLNPDILEWAYKAQNTASQDNAFAVALRTAALLYPESEIHGTSTCRAIIIGQSGYLINSEWKGLLPLTIDFAEKVAKYMGAGSGSWVNSQNFGVAPRNQVTLFRGVNIPYKSELQYNKDWDAGLVWAQNFDRRTLFYPAFQTVYPDDTSVLNSFFTMAACVELEKVAQGVWRELSGNDTLTADQFIETSNRLIRERTTGRFDGRFVIEPNTFYTEADELRGYSWSCNIDIYANNMKTVGTFTIVAHRMEDAPTA